MVCVYHSRKSNKKYVFCSLIVEAHRTVSGIQFNLQNENKRVRVRDRERERETEREERERKREKERYIGKEE